MRIGGNWMIERVPMIAADGKSDHLRRGAGLSVDVLEIFGTERPPHCCLGAGGRLSTGLCAVSSRRDKSTTPPVEAHALMDLPMPIARTAAHAPLRPAIKAWPAITINPT